jgi:hypothetical protein
LAALVFLCLRGILIVASARATSHGCLCAELGRFSENDFKRVPLGFKFLEAHEGVWAKIRRGEARHPLLDAYKIGSAF